LLLFLFLLLLVLLSLFVPGEFLEVWVAFAGRAIFVAAELVPEGKGLTIAIPAATPIAKPIVTLGNRLILPAERLIITIERNGVLCWGCVHFIGATVVFVGVLV
jgi:hypothetical protein